MNSHTGLSACVKNILTHTMRLSDTHTAEYPSFFFLTPFTQQTHLQLWDSQSAHVAGTGSGKCVFIKMAVNILSLNIFMGCR